MKNTRSMVCLACLIHQKPELQRRELISSAERDCVLIGDAPSGLQAAHLTFELFLEKGPPCISEDYIVKAPE